MKTSHIQRGTGGNVDGNGEAEKSREVIFTLCLSLVARRNAREEGEAPREKEEENETTRGRKLFPTESFASEKNKQKQNHTRRKLREDTISKRPKWIRSSRFVNHCLCVWSLCTLCLLSCQVRLTVGDWVFVVVFV